MPDSRPLACVLGDMDLVRPLGLAGIRCAVVAREGDPMRYSRFTAAVLEWSDPWKHAEALVERLVRFAEAQPERPVLFYEEDRDLLLVSRFRDRLSSALRFVVADAELVEDLVDKSRFRTLAERTGLPVPPTQRIAPGQGTAPSDVDLAFPVVLKPLTRRMERWEPLVGTRKALRVESATQLRELWPALEAAGLELLAQELVPGPESRIESYHVYVDAAGEIAGEFTGRKIRTYPAEYGYSTALEITGEEDVAELGRELTRRLGLRGVAKFDFKRAPDGRLYLLEVNPRFNLWHHPGALSGVNLPALVWADLTDNPRPPTGTARPGVRWCYPWHDYPAARGAGISTAGWLRWALRCEAKSAVALDDPMPFVRGVLWRRAARYLRRRRGAAPAGAEGPVLPVARKA